MTVATDITIVGAGPYGLSIGAHLGRMGLNFRIIGTPMHNWLAKMPKGMLLKSPGFGSNLCDPGRSFSLRRFCKDQGIAYHDVHFPVPLEIFCSYGLAFQKRFVSHLENDHLLALEPCAEGFVLRMESGKSFKSRRVILAVGIDYFQYIPEALARLPKELLTHSGEHHDLQRFRGQNVVVIGGGASAIDIAVLLHEAQAKVQHIVRKRAMDIGPAWGEFSRPLWHRIRKPISGIGPGWRNQLCTDVPWLYRYLPDHLRLRIAKTHLGPSGAWFMKDRAAPVSRLFGYQVEQASVFGGRVKLRLASDDGSSLDILVDHVIAATGYKADVGRLSFLSPDILGRLRLVEKYPRLSAHFESSVPGLYFIGPITAASFGPAMRFVVGADFTARRISVHLA